MSILFSANRTISFHFIFQLAHHIFRFSQNITKHCEIDTWAENIFDKNIVMQIYIRIRCDTISYHSYPVMSTKNYIFFCYYCFCYCYQLSAIITRQNNEWNCAFFFQFLMAYHFIGTTFDTLDHLIRLRGTNRSFNQERNSIFN